MSTPIGEVELWTSIEGVEETLVLLVEVVRIVLREVLGSRAKSIKASYPRGRL